MRLKISARKSDLARLQAYTVGEELQKIYPTMEIEYRFKESLGDINLHDPLWKIPEKGVFTEDFFGELIQGQTDMVVHSWKDLPTEGKAETFIAATLPRADQRDLLLIKKDDFAKIKSSKKLKVFSSSPRRSYNLTPFLKSHMPFQLEEVEFHSVRGNIPTRIRKLLEDSETSALILAKAALDRLLTAPQQEFSEVQETLRGYLKNLDWMVLPLSINPNAAAQGALAIEIRKDRQDLMELLKPIHHQATFEMAQAERDELSAHGGGCHQKIGISFLKKPYGVLKILKGLTSQGRLLDELAIVDSKAKAFTTKQMWCEKDSSVYFDREAVKHSVPRDRALFIAKADAVAGPLPEHTVLWTAGLKTWEKLAKLGYWVHGSSESLGEHEDAALDVLAEAKGQKLDWLKLTHVGAKISRSESLGTYQLIRNSSLFDFEQKESFFWHSGTLFVAAVTEHPEILKKHHASGPGNTANIIRQYLALRGIDAKEYHHVFLNEESWRKSCQI